MTSTVKSVDKKYCYSEVNILSTSLTNLVVTTSNIWALFGASNAFEVVVGNRSIHVDSTEKKVRRMSLVDNVNINHDGRTFAAFDMHDKVEVKENPDAVRDNLVQETESEENSGWRQSKLTKKGKEYKMSLLQSRKQRLDNQLMRKCCAIDDLLYSKDHFVTVKKELHLFDSLFSTLLLLREELFVWWWRF